MPARTVFVSHAHADNETCDRYVAALRHRGLDVWYDRTNLEAGRFLSVEIQRQLTLRTAFVLMLTRASTDSYWVRLEMDAYRDLAARDPNRIMLVVRIEPCEIPPLLRGLPRVDTVNLPFDRAIDEIVAALAAPPTPPGMSRHAPRTPGNRFRLPLPQWLQTLMLTFLAVLLIGALLLIGPGHLGAFWTPRAAGTGHNSALGTALPTFAPTGPAGSVIWRYQVGGPVAAALAVSDGVVYAASWDSYLYALSEASGGLVWRYSTPGHLEAAPAVIGGVVYIGSPAATLYAFDPTHGALLQQYPTGSIDDSTPLVLGETLYIGDDDGNISAFHVGAPAPLWRFQTGGGVLSGPVAADGILYVGSSDHALYALDASTGRPLWHYTTGDAVSASPMVSHGVVYVASNDRDVYALAARTGKLLWRYETGDGIYSTPIVANGTVYVGSNDHYLYALNATTGRVQWFYLAAGPIGAAATVAGPLIYVTSEDGMLSALSASTGTLIWHVAIGASGTPTVDRGRIFVGCADRGEYFCAVQA